MTRNFMHEMENKGLVPREYRDLDPEKFARLHHRVGPVKLEQMARQINTACEILGYKERVTANKYRSIYKPEMLEKPLLNFCEPKKFMPRDKSLFREAVSAVRRKYTARNVKPISLEQAYQRLLSEKEKHNAGLPTLGKKEDDIGAIDRARMDWAGKCPPPAVISHRGKNPEVVRAVWMFPFEWHIIEAAFYYPLFEVFRSELKIYPVGPLYERRYLTRKLSSSARYSNGSKFSLDYSSFDASLSPKLIGCAFEILSGMMTLSEKETKVWERVQTYFTTCPFVAPDGVMYVGRRGGVPSGSMFTQLVDSLCNAILIEYAMRRLNISDFRYLVYGDDSWIICNTTETPRTVLDRIQSYTEELGMKMNAAKSGFSRPEEPLLFCGHYDIVRGRPLQDTIDKIVYPERPSKYIGTKNGMCERLVAYMADSDNVELLNIIYYAISRGVSVEQVAPIRANVIPLFAATASLANKRHLPGILQVVDTLQADAATFMKIRASL